MDNDEVLIEAEFLAKLSNNLIFRNFIPIIMLAGLFGSLFIIAPLTGTWTPASPWSVLFGLAIEVTVFFVLGIYYMINRFFEALLGRSYYDLRGYNQ